MRDLQLQRFGRLVAVCPTKKRRYEKVVWLCRCDCGNLTEVISSDLFSSHTRSCGCFNKEQLINNKRAFKHGGKANGGELRLYRTWLNMKRRCLNKKDDDYKYYGGRGIFICNAWIDNYQNFEKWALANGYVDGLTVDRVDNDSGYEPSNCQWIPNSDNVKKAHINRRLKTG